MAKAYRYFDMTYHYKFEVEDEGNPIIWALNKQAEGFKIEEGTMVWDERDNCGWEWVEKTLSDIPPQTTKITKEIFFKVTDMFNRGISQGDISRQLDMSYRTINDIVNVRCKKYKEFKERRDGIYNG